jgi:polysaccharide biosynthesis transport protein
MVRDEISLGEIIDMVIRHKWVIISITISCMLLTAIANLFIIDAKYEASSIVRLQSADASIKVFEETLKNSSTLNAIIEKYQLDRSTHSIDSIRDMFKLEVMSEQNTMKITVQGNDPKKISQIANMLAMEVGSLVEIADITQYMAQLHKKQILLQENIAATRARLIEVQIQLKDTPEKLTVKQVLTNNDLLRDIVQESTGKSAMDAAAIGMENEVINPVYTDLRSKIAHTTIELNTYLKDEENTSLIIEANRKRINDLENKVSDIGQLDVTKSIQITDGTNSIVITPSMEPEQPVGPKTLLNVAISIVVSGILSLLFVFFKHLRKLGRE